MSEKGFRLPSYRPHHALGCRRDCLQGTPARPCWGRVDLTGEVDDTPVYECEGHKGVGAYGEPYKTQTASAGHERGEG